MTVNYSAYNDIISTYFIAGCGHSSALPHTKGCHGKAKTQASPMSAVSLGPIIIWGRCQFTNMVVRISCTCSVSSHVLGPGRRFNQHSLHSRSAYSLWDSHSPCPAFHMSIIGFAKQPHGVETTANPLSLQMRKPKLREGKWHAQGHTVNDGAGFKPGQPDSRALILLAVSKLLFPNGRKEVLQQRCKKGPETWKWG